jgi:hypothetical protein
MALYKMIIARAQLIYVSLFDFIFFPLVFNSLFFSFVIDYFDADLCSTAPRRELEHTLISLKVRFLIKIVLTVTLYECPQCTWTL